MLINSIILKKDTLLDFWHVSIEAYTDICIMPPSFLKNYYYRTY